MIYCLFNQSENRFSPFSNFETSLQYPALKYPSISNVEAGKNKTPVSFNNFLHKSTELIFKSYFKRVVVPPFGSTQVI